MPTRLIHLWILHCHWSTHSFQNEDIMQSIKWSMHHFRNLWQGKQVREMEYQFIVHMSCSNKNLIELHDEMVVLKVKIVQFATLCNAKAKPKVFCEWYFDGINWNRNTFPSFHCARSKSICDLEWQRVSLTVTETQKLLIVSWYIT